jgi:hypothetical protein
MATEREKRLSEKGARSKGISDLIRYISFGLVALTFSLFTSKAVFAVTLLTNYKTLFLLASLFGAVAIAFDYFHYLSGYVAVNKALKKDSHFYETSWISYWLIKPLFVLKQLFAISGVVLVCIAMFKSTVA